MGIRLTLLDAVQTHDELIVDTVKQLNVNTGQIAELTKRLTASETLNAELTKRIEQLEGIIKWKP